MIEPRWVFAAATLLGASGMWLLLPRGTGRGRVVGAVLATLAVAAWGSRATSTGSWAADGTFFVLAAATMGAAVATLTCRNTVSCCLWFGVSSLSLAALLLLIGCGLVVTAAWSLYAAALVTAILLVLVLGRLEGEQAYDLSSWETLLSAATGMVLAGVLSMTLCDMPRDSGPSATAADSAGTPETALLRNALTVGALLFGVGVVGFVSRRNMVVMILAVQVLLQGVLLSLAAFDRFHGDSGARRLMLAILATAAVHCAVSLMIAWTCLRQTGKLDVIAWHGLREANQPPPDEPHV